MRHRNRSIALLGLLALIGAGLGSRHRGMPGFVLLYVGDVLWGAMFFVLFACLWPPGAGASTLRLASWALATTELIEFSQLYQGSEAQRVRATAVGGLLLGHGFLWSDVLCVALGVAAAALIDAARSRARSGRRPDPSSSG